MKVYKCDACEAMIEDPYEVHMREFFLTWPERNRLNYKRKVHLCKYCFENLGRLFKKANTDSKQNAPKNRVLSDDELWEMACAGRSATNAELGVPDNPKSQMLSSNELWKKVCAGQPITNADLGLPDNNDAR